MKSSVQEKWIFIVVSCLIMGICPVYAKTIDSCHPLPESGVPQYIVGYGSLINYQARMKSHKNSGVNLPIRLSGFKRGWFVEGSSTGFSTTFLGVYLDDKFSINAVAFRLLGPNDIKIYDDRENSYCRTLIKHSKIKMLTAESIPHGQFWIYTAEPTAVVVPSERYPIVQSYVDKFLSGCFMVEKNYKLKNFADECVSTTYDWSAYWVNDRIYPRRPFVYQPYASKIDKLLNASLHKYFIQIRIQ